MRRSAQVGRVVAAAAAVLVVGLGSGCSGSSAKVASTSAADRPIAGAEGGSSGGSDVAPNAAAPSKAGAAGAPAAPGTSGGTGGTGGTGQNALAKTPIVGRSLVYTATLTVRTQDVAAATANAETLAASNGGFVGNENSQSGTVADTKGLTQSTVTLRVPSTAFDKVISQLGTGGTVQDETRSASDVTAQVVDTDTRVTAQQASIARITDLMKNATNLSDVVSLEGELSRREADLESMQAQQAALNDQVSLSTITVTFLVPQAPAPKPPAAAQHQNALQRGLHDGWQVFVGTVKVLLVVIGALLPFAILAVILWWPVTRLVRLAPRLQARLTPAAAKAAATPRSVPAYTAPAPPSASASAADTDRSE